MSRYFWEFPSNNDGSIHGFNDEGLRTFRSNEGLGSVIRECIQNSIDARRESTLPVKVEISLPSIPFKEFPDIKGFENILKSCRDYKYSQDNKAIQDFYKNALSLVQGEFKHCDFLRISDYNTKGLKRETFEEVFIKGTGITVKENEGSAGSHGIGKKAVFNFTQIRTAFYSSIDTDNNRCFIGKSILQSHKKDDGATSQGIGYFADQPRNKPIVEVIDELKFLNNRDEPGLDVFITAFDKDDTTKDNVILAVLENFYPALNNNDLIVNVMGQNINVDTLPGLVDQYSESKYKKLHVKKALDTFPIAKFYETLISSKDKDGDNLVENRLSIYENNDVLVKTLNNDGNNRVHYHRHSGMIVKIENIRCPLKLTTIVSIKGDKLNSFLKQLENVSHDGWQIGQLDDDSAKSEAKKIIPMIEEAIKENINSFIDQDSSDEIDMSGAAKYLEDDFDDINNQENPSDNNVEESDKEENLSEKHENFIIKKPNTKISKKNRDEVRKKYSPDDEGKDEEYVPGGGGTSRKKNKPLSEKEDGDIEKPDFTKYTLNKIRLVDSQESGDYAFLLSSNDHINCYFSMHALSEDGNENILHIEECQSGNEFFEVNDDKTLVGPLELKANQEVTIHLSLIEKSRMALQLSAFVDKNE